MREVFTNVLSNAVKYSRDGGMIAISAASAQDGVTFHVADAGLGIPMEARSRIFTKFYRAPNVIEGIEGTGLGLYIVKAIVEKHGGEVTFDSGGKGTTFHIRMPLAAASASDGAVPSR
ncbi:MAG: hypothetical protein RLZZ324_1175 [Candidatus Parcubacteria bacterium]